MGKGYEMKKIVITTSSFAEFDNAPLDLLRSKGLEVSLNPFRRKLRKEEIPQLCEGAEGIIAGVETLDKETLGKLKDLRVISRCGAGMENVDLEAAKGLGINVLNTPDAPTIAVAELTVGLILNLLKKTSVMHAQLKAGNWDKRMGNLLYGKRVGIIGFGRIGRKVSQLIKAFACDISYSDPEADDGVLGCRRLPLEELLGTCDVITIHSSGDRMVLGEKEFSLLKKPCWLINAARGQAIDEGLLYDYLKDGRVAGAALDVFQNEPYTGALRELDNVILTPHIGSYAVEARVLMEKQAAENLLRGIGL